VETRGLTLERSDGRMASGPASVRAELAPAGATVALDVERMTGDVAMFRGALARLVGSARLQRTGNAFALGTADLAARDPTGQDALTATLKPAGRAGRLAVSARAPALERL